MDPALITTSLRGMRTHEGWVVDTVTATEDAITAMISGADQPLVVTLHRPHGERVWWSHVAADMDRLPQFYSRRERNALGRTVWRRLVAQVLREGRAVGGEAAQHMCVTEDGETWAAVSAAWLDGDGNATSPPPCAPPPCLLMPLT